MRLMAPCVCLIGFLAAMSGVQARPSNQSSATGFTPEILVTAFHGRQWQARYDFDVPVARIVFARSPDDSRSRTWIPDEGFEIVATEAGEVARRKDGETFRTVRFRMSPIYTVLPKDYAPFSPFGDGGMLLHTGRFFACAEACPDDASWPMTLWAAPEDRIILDGRQARGQARWIDSSEGRAVYVGSNVATQTRDVVALLDEALPAAIRTQLLTQLPAFMHGFSKKFGALPKRPMLFVSYDGSPLPGHAGKFGNQGGVLPGQIFMHFYGSRWPVEMTQSKFADGLAWHFAHEAAHLYQKNFSGDEALAWIHEGAAEAFADLALRSLDASTVEFAESKTEGAKDKCRQQLGGRTVHDALIEGTFDVAYSCGLLLHLRIDAEIRRVTQQDGLYAVWQEYAAQSRPSDEGYLAAIAKAGGAALADWVRRMVRTRDPDFARSE